MHRKPDAVCFLTDFKPLERELARGTSCPVERMIVELGITPRNVRSMERGAGIEFPWFRPAYVVMKRHGLVPTDRSWDNWMRRYTMAKKAARRASPSKAPAKH